MSVEQLSQDALDSLAARFLSDLYSKAGKKSPFCQAPKREPA